MIRRSLAPVLTLMLGVAVGSAGAQTPDGTAVDQARAEALALNKAGAARVAKKDWAGALDKFQQAYAAFPSPKVLKNIGEMLKEMGRFADAANVYQRWLDDPGAESSKRAEVVRTLATLDASLGLLVVTAVPADAEVQVDGWNPSWLAPSADPTWRPIAQSGRVRVPAGRFAVRARRAGYLEAEVAGTVAAAGAQTVALRLVEEPRPVEPVAETDVEPATDPVTTGPSDELSAPAPARVRAVQLGALVDVAFDGNALFATDGDDMADGKGQGLSAAISPGISLRLADRIELIAKAQIGGSAGGYVGASAYLSTGRVRPQLTVGLPVFFSDGMRLAGRAGAGVSFELGARFSAVVDLGGEYFFNPEMGRDRFVLVPIVGAHARL